MPARSPESAASGDPSMASRAERRAAARGRVAGTPLSAGKVHDPGRRAPAPRQYVNRRRG